MPGPGARPSACASRPPTSALIAPARRIRPGDPDFMRAAAEADHVLDCAGGELQVRALVEMRPGAKLAAIVTPVDEAAAVARGIEAIFVVLETRPDTLAAVADAAARGVLRPDPPAVFDFEEAASAYRDYVAGRRTGELGITTGVGRCVGSGTGAGQS